MEGDAYRRYVIQGSSNLADWATLTTNFSPATVRPLNFSISNGFGFYRSAPFTRTNLLSKAIQTTGSFDWNGNLFQLDSFDSRDPLYSTNGRYDVLKRKDAAELSSDQELTNSLPVGSVRIYGSISTGRVCRWRLGRMELWETSRGLMAVKREFNREDFQSISILIFLK